MGLWQLAQTGALFSLVRKRGVDRERFSCSSAWHWRQIAEDLLLNCSRLLNERCGWPCPWPENSHGRRNSSVIDEPRPCIYLRQYRHPGSLRFGT